MLDFKIPYVKNLPGSYDKTDGSNNDKILAIEAGAISALREDAQAVFDTLDIDNATGKTLDQYGEMLGQARGTATDPQYIAILKTRIMRNLLAGDQNSLIDAICLIFRADASEIFLEQTAPYCVNIEGLPFSEIIYAGFTAEQAIELIKSIMPAGVSISDTNFEGTFEFASTESDYDTTKGFSEVEGGTIGGYLGYLAG